MKLSLVCVDKLNNVDDNCEPATSAELNLGPTVSIAAANSVYDIPAEDAAVPDFSNATFKYSISAEPCCEAAANTFIISVDSDALAPI